jgi:hypothetical protein
MGAEAVTRLIRHDASAELSELNLDTALDWETLGRLVRIRVEALHEGVGAGAGLVAPDRAAVVAALTGQPMGEDGGLDPAA